MAARTSTTPSAPAPDGANDVSEDAPRAAAGADEALARELDALSLAQALRDFEVANERVVDLTRRLIESLERGAELQRELDEVRTAFHTLNVEHHTLRTSGAYRLSEKILALRNLLRG